MNPSRAMIPALLSIAACAGNSGEKPAPPAPTLVGKEEISGLATSNTNGSYANGSNPSSSNPGANNTNGTNASTSGANASKTNNSSTPNRTSNSSGTLVINSKTEQQAAEDFIPGTLPTFNSSPPH